MASLGSASSRSETGVKTSVTTTDSQASSSATSIPASSTDAPSTSSVIPSQISSSATTTATASLSSATSSISSISRSTTTSLGPSSASSMAHSSPSSPPTTVTSASTSQSSSSTSTILGQQPNSTGVKSEDTTSAKIGVTFAIIGGVVVGIIIVTYIIRKCCLNTSTDFKKRRLQRISTFKPRFKNDENPGSFELLPSGTLSRAPSIDHTPNMPRRDSHASAGSTPSMTRFAGMQQPRGPPTAPLYHSQLQHSVSYSSAVPVTQHSGQQPMPQYYVDSQHYSSDLHPRQNPWEV